MFSTSSRLMDAAEFIYNIMSLVVLVISFVFITIAAFGNIGLTWEQATIPLAIFAGMKFGECIGRLAQYIVIEYKEHK